MKHKNSNGANLGFENKLGPVSIWGTGDLTEKFIEEAGLWVQRSRLLNGLKKSR